MVHDQRKYGLGTAIAMIVGIVIGSGIFFKVDDILIQTNGDVLVGAFTFIIGAVGIIFAGLSLAQYAKEDDQAGGIITYIENVFGKRLAFLTGWFQGTTYFPALAAILAWVSANYTLMLFSNLNLNIWVVTLVYLAAIFTMNVLAPKLAGHFQTSTTLIKLVPLLVLAVLGLAFGEVNLDLANFTFTSALGATSAIVAVAYAYDGWSIAPSICHEIKHSKRNLPLALTIAPIIIMVVYLTYYLGVVAVVGADQIMVLGDAYIETAFIKIFGELGAKGLLVFVVISVLGTTNGLILAGSRVPYALAIRDEIPFSKQIGEIKDNQDMPVTSAWVFLAFTLFWLGIHYLASQGIVNVDISELPIIIMYLFYTLLFAGLVIKFKRKEITNPIHGIVYPLLAILGALVVLYGGFTGSAAMTYLVISILVILSGYVITLVKSKETAKKS
ncbi:MAG: APC family permease [Erysipelotrichaceae bacterium]